MDELEKTLVSSTLWKIIATIIAFVWILNIITTWFGVKGLNIKEDLLKLIVFVISIFFWIPGIILSLKYIWIDNK